MMAVAVTATTKNSKKTTNRLHLVPIRSDANLSTLSLFYKPDTLTIAHLSIKAHSHHFNSHFPRRPGLASTRMSPVWILFELRSMMEVVVTTGGVRRANSSQIITTNKPTPIFLQDGCPS